MRKKKWLLVILISLLLFESFGIQQVIAANDDWHMDGKDPYRTKYVDDTELNPVILFKARLKLGWSTSQVLAVGDYFYVVASTPNRDNLFGLSRGTYLYRIPIDFNFQGNYSRSQQVEDLLKKGARWVRITDYVQSYSSPTYDPVTGLFYVGVGERVYVVDEDPFTRKPYVFDFNARLTASPLMVGNDLFAIATSTSKNNGGRLYLVKGLGSGRVSFARWSVSTLQNAEIANATKTDGDGIGVGVNYRDSIRQGRYAVFDVKDNGFGSKPSLSFRWKEPFTAETGVAAHGIYYGGNLYFADKYGGIYSLRASDGYQRWKTKISNVTLINNTMTTDGSSIYIPVRRPGKLVKINMSNGNIQWIAEQGKQRNGNKIDNDLKTGRDIENNPVFWDAPDGRRIVFYGDRAGQINFLSHNGYRVLVAAEKEGGFVRSSIKGSSISGDIHWEVQGMGASTEMLLAKNHLVFGVNTSETNGETWFYSVGIADDVYVKSVESGNYVLGQNVFTKVRVGNKDFSTGTRVPLIKFYVDGKLVGQRRIDLPRGSEKDIYFNWKATKSTNNGEIYVTINLNPTEFDEITFDNNYKYGNYSTTGDNYVNYCEVDELRNMGVVKTVTICDSMGQC